MASIFFDNKLKEQEIFSDIDVDVTNKELDFNKNLDMKQNKIINIGDATSAYDCVNLKTVSSLIDGGVHPKFLDYYTKEEVDQIITTTDDALQAKINVNTSDLNTAKDDIATNTDRINQIDPVVAYNRNNIIDLQNTVDENNMETINKFDLVDLKIGALQNRAITNENDILQVGADVQLNSTDIDQNNQLINKNIDDITNLKNTVTTITADYNNKINNVQNHLSNNTTNLDKFSTELNTLYNNVSVNTSDIQHLQSQINNNNSNLIDALVWGNKNIIHSSSQKITVNLDIGKTVTTDTYFVITGNVNVSNYNNVNETFAFFVDDITSPVMIVSPTRTINNEIQSTGIASVMTFRAVSAGESTIPVDIMILFNNSTLNNSQSFANEYFNVNYRFNLRQIIYP